MKTVRFYNLFAERMENDVFTSHQMANELMIELPEDFDLDNAFEILTEKTGQDICSFSYENIG